MSMLCVESRSCERFIPTPEDLQKEIPFTDKHAQFIVQSRKICEAILNGWDSRYLIIAGPCSIHDISAAKEYARRFRNLAERVSDQFFLIMRTYFEKARTTIGWKGMLYDPDLDGSHNLTKGIRQTRQLLAELAEMHVPAGCELLEINTAHYYTDFLTWGCVGARTSSSPPHRQLAATLNFPIGFKNSTDGNIDHPIHGILAAAMPHVYLGLSPSGRMIRVQAKGNTLCHLILRGSHLTPNYYPEAIQLAIQKCRRARVRDRLLIDCAHGNSSKNLTNQEWAFQSVIQQIGEGNNYITGVMLESHLASGSQEICPPLQYGVSITDPCIDWETTEQLILEAHKKLKQRTIQRQLR